MMARLAAGSIVCAALGAAADPAANAGVDVRALLQAWVAAQNAGDFAAYSALYADDFKGVRVAGSKAELDKPAWLREAQPAFVKSAPVRLYFVEVLADSVSFVQVSRSTREVSAREMTIARVGGRDRIVGEDLLGSRPLPVSSAAGWFRVDEHGDVILWEGSLPPPGLPPRLFVHRGDTDESEVVVDARLPWRAMPDAARFQPSPVTFQLVSAKKTTSCKADEPRIAKRLTGGVRQLGDEEIARLARADQLEPWTIAAALPDCGSFDDAPAFARLDDRVRPKTATPRRAARDVAAKAFAAFKELPAWKSVGPKGTPGTVEIQLPTATGRARFVALSYESEQAGCAAWALWKVPDDAAGRWELLHDPSDLTALYPQLAADLDGDGKPELFGSDSAAPLLFQQFALGWSTSGLGPGDRPDWIPLSRAHCGE